MNITSPTRQIWKSAELLISFHKNKKRERRDSPFLWRPKEEKRANEFTIVCALKPPRFALKNSGAFGHP